MDINNTVVCLTVVTVVVSCQDINSQNQCPLTYGVDERCYVVIIQPPARGSGGVQ